MFTTGEANLVAKAKGPWTLFMGGFSHFTSSFFFFDRSLIRSYLGGSHVNNYILLTNHFLSFRPIITTLKKFDMPILHIIVKRELLFLFTFQFSIKDRVSTSLRLLDDRRFTFFLLKTTKQQDGHPTENYNYSNKN